MKLPTLYKLNSNSKLMQWDIECDTDLGSITTTFGQVEGKLQSTTDIVSEGKNIGKSNETTILEQTELEAKAKWKHQIDIKGYVTEVAKALSGKDDRKGFSPMLAKVYEDEIKKVKYISYLQPKLDGIRLLSIISSSETNEDSEVKLFSRNGKPVTSVPHIAKQVLEAFSVSDLALIDGELYSDDLKDNFEDLVSIAKKQKQVDKDEVLQYHIYDFAGTDLVFSERTAKLKSILVNSDGSPKFSHLRYVQTIELFNQEEVKIQTDKFVEQGYEGGMVRSANSLYKSGRSSDLLKVKLFMDDEFEVVGIEEGNGKLIGHVGSFICRTKEGQEFGAKMTGKQSNLKDYFDNHSLWTGKFLTVRYFGLSKTNKVPRFPTGIILRDYE